MRSAAGIWVVMKYLSALACLPLTLACVGHASLPSVGSPIEASAVQSVRKCETTETELRATFGEPYREGIVDGMRTMTWMYQPGGSVVAGDASSLEEISRGQQMLVVAVSDANVVEDLIYNPPPGVIWQPRASCGQ